MSRDKQIEEMAKTLNEATFGVNKHIIADHIHKPEAIEEIATHLYNAGYRKSTDLAEEIFAEIEEAVGDIINRFPFAKIKYLELKKKYTKEIMEEE